jgi:hypothetical protein
MVRRAVRRFAVRRIASAGAPRSRFVTGAARAAAAVGRAHRRAPFGMRAMVASRIPRLLSRSRPVVYSRER